MFLQSMAENALKMLMQNPAVEKAAQDALLHVLQMYERVERIEAKLDAVLALHNQKALTHDSRPTGQSREPAFADYPGTSGNGSTRDAREFDPFGRDNN
jgi:hypothetical protein